MAVCFVINWMNDLNCKWVSINFSFSLVTESLEEYVPLKEWMVNLYPVTFTPNILLCSENNFFFLLISVQSEVFCVTVDEKLKRKRNQENKSIFSSQQILTCLFVLTIFLVAAGDRSVLFIECWNKGCMLKGVCSHGIGIRSKFGFLGWQTGKRKQTHRSL